jgi:hypothetical protein
MSILDHRKTWHFQLKGSPQDCVAAFTAAFTAPGGGGIIAKAKWDVSRSGDGAVAIYRGRAGLVKGLTILSSMATAEEQGAIGSQVTFEIEGVADGQVKCAMWLSHGASRLGFTNDGRFFRPYMRSVEGQLRRVDPTLAVGKS